MSTEHLSATASDAANAAGAPATDKQQYHASAPVDESSAQPAETPIQEGVAGVEDGVAGMNLGQAQQSELHRACAEGRLDDVRAILGSSLEALETLDMATGCTPIVLAVTNGHADVVRELLAAGAIVPPPGLTMDPLMLSILYPQPVYGVPPPFGQMPPHFFPQQGFFPPGADPRYTRKEGGSPSANGTGATNANLPPADVAKTIPCRNFPNCKYGAACMFFHPRPQNPGFFPGAPGFYEGGFAPYPGAAPFFPGAQEFIPNGASPDPAAEQSQDSTAEAGAEVSANGTTQHASIPASSAPHIPSAGAPAFIPGAMPIHMPNGDANGPQFIGSPPAGYAMGALSPTLMPSNAPPMPADAAYFATSPPQFQGFVPNGYAGHGRRQSFGQPFAAGGPPKPYMHGKKPSFSGGPKPWAPGGRPGGSSHLGQWKDGNPPPCAFFREGKCRNGEYCKFPHVDAEGNDCRHPDVVRGIIPPMPTRPPRVMRMMQGGHYDPALRHQQQVHFMQGNKAAAAPVPETAAEGAETGVTTPASDKEAAAAPANAALPPKPSGSLPPSRSASQPGVARVQANGVNSRSHSPNGVRRPRTYPNGQQGGSRSSSTGGTPNGDAKKAAPPQRIPRADEFPALGVPNGVAVPNGERRETSWGKTAAQVLSEPAPAKPEEDKEEAPKAKVEDKAEVKAEEQVTMDSDSEQDAVIVSVSTTPNPEVAKAKLASAVSFASVAGTVGAEATPVALKA